MGIQIEPTGVPGPASELHVPAGQMPLVEQGSAKQYADETVDPLILWQVASDITDDAVVGLDPNARVRAINQGAGRLFGYTAEEICGQPVSALFTDIPPQLLRPIAGTRRGLAQTEARRQDGSTIPVSVNTGLLPDGGGACLVVRDLSGEAEAKLKTVEAMSALEVQSSLWDMLQRITNIADAAADLTEALHTCMLEFCRRLDWPVGHAVLLDASGVRDSHIWYLADHEKYGPLRAVLEDESGAKAGLTAQVLATRDAVWLDQPPDWGATADAAARVGVDSGFAFPVSIDGQAVAAVEMLGRAGSASGSHLLACARHGSVQLGRVLERERSRLELSHRAMHDALTELPNRSLFLDRLAQAVRALRSGGPHLAVLFVDLDDFKLINDSLGHDIGDHVLRTVARRLGEIQGPNDTVARFGGDEFIILSERLSSDEAVGDIAERVLAAVSEPMLLSGSATTVVTGSIGVAIATSPEAEPEHLIRDADAAMYRAKEDGRGRFNVFDRGLHDRARHKLSIGNDLRRAVNTHEFRLVYQPQFRMSDGQLIGVEALARWDNPGKGTLPPADWIPIAEETQLIVPIGEWVLAEACRVAADWLSMPSVESQESGFKVCVNVSAVQLARPELVDGVISALTDTGVNPGNMCIEVTESVLMAAPGTYLEALLGLKLLGLSIAVDDFGTGYSSLAYLHRFPIDVIKVDKGFVDGLGMGDARGRSILKAVIQLSDALGVVSVAEGVETAEQARILLESGCQAAQGYFFGRPQSAEAITELLLAKG